MTVKGTVKAQPRDPRNGRFLSLAEDHTAKSPTTLENRIYGRSAVSNGALFLAADGRSRTGRRFRDLVEHFSAPWGDFEHAPETVRQLIRTAARLQVLTEIMDSELANGEPVNPNQHVRCTNALHRTLLLLDKSKPKQKPNAPAFANPFVTDNSKSLAELMSEHDS